MPFQQDTSAGFLNVIARGQITGEDLLRLHAELSHEAGRHVKCLIDFTEADVSKLTGPIVRELSRLPPRFERLAIVAKPGLAYGLGRTYQTTADRSRTIGVFMTVENATSWLTQRARSGGPPVDTDVPVRL